ncbi:MAG: 3-keto-5-aminohexanoate cleavage protein [Firmicutes bacterium]|nr:3-keto-5-aminohexanoate cleavage protein [Bacillota bacterium]
MEKLIITVAPTGSVPTKKENPNLPVTPEEVIEDAVRCFGSGASVIHLHARDSEQRPVHDQAFFRQTMEGIREKTNLILQVSTGGRANPSWESRSAALELRPEMASLTTGSVNFPDRSYVNEPAFIEYLARKMQDCGIKPEMEIFDLSMVSNAVDLVRKGLAEEPLHFNFVLGLPGALPFNPANLVYLVQNLPPGATWTVSGIGRAQLPAAILAIIMGGHVRVGLEDNIYYQKGLLATNVALVDRVVRLARELGREIASPDEARRILHLK